jgi:NAD-dependent SIR2 family protein deacetylase
MTSFGTIQTRLAFSVHENKGIYALLIGSGVSRSAGIPTGWEITLDLVQKVAQAEGVAYQDDWSQWYKDTYGKSPDYSDLLEQLASTAAVRRQILSTYIEPSEDEREDGVKLPTAAHHAIARLVRDGLIKVIITTNFDRLTENALREAGIEPTIVNSVDALNGAVPYTHADCYIIKVHGDYKDTRILNTDGELQNYPPEIDALLDRILDDFGLIVCGWSGEWDHALRKAVLRSPNRRYPWFWASRGALSARGRELLDHRKGHLIPIADADSFFTELVEKVSTVARVGQSNPADVDVLLARVKKYLSKPEYRIELSDLMDGEVQKVTTRISQDDLAPGVQLTGDELRRRVGVYQSAGEGLIKAAALVGVWGDNSHIGLLAAAIREIWISSRIDGAGFQDALAIRGYIAVLAVNAACLGFIKSGRFDRMREFLLTETASRANKQDETFLRDLSAIRWEGSDKATWNLLFAPPGKLTPFTIHLFDYFERELLGIIGPKVDLESNYLLLEALFAFQSIESLGLDQLKNALNPADGGRSGVWMPVAGRIGWDRWGRKALLENLDQPKLQSRLAKAGYFYSDSDFSAMFTALLRNGIESLHWI